MPLPLFLILEIFLLVEMSPPLYLFQGGLEMGNPTQFACVKDLSSCKGICIATQQRLWNFQSKKMFRSIKLQISLSKKLLFLKSATLGTVGCNAVLHSSNMDICKKLHLQMLWVNEHIFSFLSIIHLFHSFFQLPPAAHILAISRIWDHIG